MLPRAMRTTPTFVTSCTRRERLATRNGALDDLARRATARASASGCGSAAPGASPPCAGTAAASAEAALARALAVAARPARRRPARRLRRSRLRAASWASPVEARPVRRAARRQARGALRGRRGARPSRALGGRDRALRGTLDRHDFRLQRGSAVRAAHAPSAAAGSRRWRSTGDESQIRSYPASHGGQVARPATSTSPALGLAERAPRHRGGGGGAAARARRVRTAARR